MKRFLVFILWQPDKSSLVKVMDEPVKVNIYFVSIENNCIYYKYILQIFGVFYSKFKDVEVLKNIS